jgi:hypothetical protein
MPNEEEWIDATMGAEEALGKPLNLKPDEGVEMMSRQVAVLRKRLAELHPDCRDTDAELGLIRDIRTAETRLKEYELLRKGSN